MAGKSLLVTTLLLTCLHWVCPSNFGFSIISPNLLLSDSWLLSEWARCTLNHTTKSRLKTGLHLYQKSSLLTGGIGAGGAVCSRQQYKWRMPSTFAYLLKHTRQPRQVSFFSEFCRKKGQSSLCDHEEDEIFEFFKMSCRQIRNSNNNNITNNNK